MCRVSHFYAMGNAVMKMPIRRFWVFHRNIDRIAAQQDQRNLMVLAAAQSTDGANELAGRLDAEIGTVLVPDVMADNLDVDGINDLKGMRFANR